MDNNVVVVLVVGVAIVFAFNQNGQSGEPGGGTADANFINKSINDINEHGRKVRRRKKRQREKNAFMQEWKKSHPGSKPPAPAPAPGDIDLTKDPLVNNVFYAIKEAGTMAPFIGEVDLAGTVTKDVLDDWRKQYNIEKSPFAHGADQVASDVNAGIEDARHFIRQNEEHDHAGHAAAAAMGVPTIIGDAVDVHNYAQGPMMIDAGAMTAQHAVEGVTTYVGFVHDDPMVQEGGVTGVIHHIREQHPQPVHHSYAEDPASFFTDAVEYSPVLHTVSSWFR